MYELIVGQCISQNIDQNLDYYIGKYYMFIESFKIMQLQYFLQNISEILLQVIKCAVYFYIFSQKTLF